MNENIKLLILLICITILLILMIIPIQQNIGFTKDAIFYKKQIEDINTKLDFQQIKITSTINKAIDEQFNNINCILEWK